MGEIRNECRTFVGKPEAGSWKDDIKRILRKQGVRVWT
jgi:hypothetical protein